MTPFHKQAAAIIMKSINNNSNSNSQNELISALTSLTLKLSGRINDLRRELEGRPFTPNILHSLIPEASIQTCRFLTDIHRAEGG